MRFHLPGSKTSVPLFHGLLYELGTLNSGHYWQVVPGCWSQFTSSLSECFSMMELQSSWHSAFILAGMSVWATNG